MGGSGRGASHRPMKSSRRHALVQIGAWVAGAGSMDGVFSRPDTRPIVLGQSVCLDGPLADLGLPMHLGAKACFEAVNAAGGINGRRIELKVRDDGYDVKRSLSNIKDFLSDESTFALFGCMGTPMIEAALPLISGSPLPCFAPFTGATTVRPASARNMFHIRASFGKEAERLVQHMITIGYRKVAIVYQDSAYGLEVSNAARHALGEHSMKPVAELTVRNDASDAKVAAGKMLSIEADALLIGLGGKPIIEFVTALKAMGARVPLYSVSAMGTPNVLKALNERARGITVSQVMPSPTDIKLALVRDFRKTFTALQPTAEPSYAALEGFVYARSFCEILRRAGPDSSPTRFMDAAWKTKNLDLGGYEISFTQPGRAASSFVELTMVNHEGRFIR